ncbi:hypothetical protein N7501_004143 [Penicillium viridicatum]|nr:hypothetical protein N7501_004143 [Penicillium viridicatum]
MPGKLKKVTAVKKPAIIGLIHFANSSDVRTLAAEAGPKGFNSSLQTSDTVPVSLWEGAALGLPSEGSSGGPDGL